jgi:ketohexokinase
VGELILSSNDDTGEEEDPLELTLIAVLPQWDTPDTTLIIDSLVLNVDVTECLHREDVTEAASSFIFRSEDGSGSRTIVNWNRLEEMSVDEFIRADKVLKADWYHFEGRNTETTLGCIRHLRASSNAKISVELEKPGREGLQEMANEADVVFYSKSWAQVGREALLMFQHLMFKG